MTTENYIPLLTLATHYKIEMPFFDELQENGLLEFVMIEQIVYIHIDAISQLEKIVRIHHELHVNTPGIDIILNLLGKIDELNSELLSTKNRLNIYE